MGNWHCIPSSCAEVVYQPYDTGKIRWRYGSEPWQEIIGADNFNSDVLKGQCCNLLYRVEISTVLGAFAGNEPSYILNQVSLYTREGTNYQANSKPYGKFSGLRFDNTQLRINGRSRAFILDWVDCLGIKRTHTISSNSDTRGWIDSLTSVKSITVVGSGIDNCGDCQFKVFKKGVIVHQETRSICPTVEKIPCSLSKVRRSVEVKKIPYLQRVEVVPYAYSAYKLPGVPAPIVQADKIPDECLNIYYNDLYVIPPSGQGIYPNGTPFSSFVGQICSAPGCPPPQYQVICDSCGCESCPGDTCPVECNGVICCYNDYGTSVKEIVKSNYCGG